MACTNLLLIICVLGIAAGRPEVEDLKPKGALPGDYITATKPNTLSDAPNLGRDLYTAFANNLCGCNIRWTRGGRPKA